MDHDPKDDQEGNVEDIYIPTMPSPDLYVAAEAGQVNASEDNPTTTTTTAAAATTSTTEESPSTLDDSFHDAESELPSERPVAAPAEVKDPQSIEKMTEMATQAFLSLSAGTSPNKKRSVSNELTSKYDTANKLSFRRAIVSETGNQVDISDSSEQARVEGSVAIKILNKFKKSPPPETLSPVRSAEEDALAAASVLDDAAFNAEWGTGIKDTLPSSPNNGHYFNGNDEILATARMTGRMWRAIFRRILVKRVDPVNALRLSRPLQLQIDYVSPLEAHLIGEVIDALDDVAMGVKEAKSKLNKALENALKNRNVGRNLVQSSGSFNILWHEYTQISYIRSFILASRVSTVSFPPGSENFLSSRGHALNSILRQVLGPGRWFTRLVTGGREEFVVDDDNAVGQNLAAESNGFELALRQQYGNYFGRQRINAFRAMNRLPTDESVVRTFTTSPASTLTNNGVVHVLNSVSKHWAAILSNPFGVFGNQRMEMLDVRQMLRFHMPVVLLTLANLRGLNSWDTETLGPLIQDLMSLGTGTDMNDAIDLITKVEEVVQDVCGGVPSRSKPFKHWLSQMKVGAGRIMEQKVQIKEIVSSVSIGIEAGYELAKINEWGTPSDSMMVSSILTHIKFDCAKKAYHKVREDKNIKEGKVEHMVEFKKDLLVELGKMNLVELEPIIPVVASNGVLHAEVKQLMNEINRLKGFEGCCQPLSGVIDTIQVTLAKDKLRQIHNNLLEAILTFVTTDLEDRKVNGMTDHLCKRALEFVTPRDKRTLIELVMKGLEDSRPAQLLLGRTKTLLRREIRRARLDDQINQFSKGETIPFAESIVRAQKAFMTIELDCTRMFAYNAFMEFDDLRNDLRKLLAISQIQCRSLDEARMNRLVAIRDSDPAGIDRSDLEIGKQYFVAERPYKYKLVTFDGGSVPSGKIYKVPPQNMLVVGGGPSGLLTTLHCLENCLKTGGTMKLYEARDAFEKAGGTYERAQVVRLDSRWVRMMRYHLGTSFEDVWVPAYGETDSHLGNNLPTQGFIEITIKDLENVLHLEISKLWSRDLIEVSSKSSAEYDYKADVMTKRGEALKMNDLVMRSVDKDGNPSDEYHTWEVVELELHQRLDHTDVSQGDFYYLYGREYSYGGLKKFQLVGTDIEDPLNPLYKFYNKDQKITTNVLASRFPAVYPEAKHGFKNIVLQCIEKNRHGAYERHYVDFEKAKKERFVMDVGQTNIVFATGKATDYKDHLKITPEEPYGVCCIQGLKISLNMHNFGEKRWGDGVVDDIRSQTEQNTRVVGDFTKSVSVVPIVKEMINILTDGHDRREDYMNEFNNLKENSGEGIRKSLMETVDATTWRRRRLQVRFFETGDNFYLGMEFTREYDKWKNTTIEELVGESMGAAIARLIDRLWYEAAFEAIRKGDVYNPSGSKFIPKVFLLKSSKGVALRSLTVGDGFRIKRNDAEKYEVLIPGSKKVWVRSVEGILSELDGDEEVLRESDLTRSPDGNAESKVAIATFPVGHVVCHRTLNVQKSSYWCTFPIGDLQASPHFMRYSGLNGAAISCMLINNYVAAGLDSTTVFSSKNRILALSKQTNWSNEEVIKRGTGANYGVDGFLRPGFKYDDMIGFLYAKAIEMSVAGYEHEDSPVDAMFQTAWLKKFAAALVPRGMELESSYIGALEHCLSKAILQKLAVEMSTDEELKEEESFLTSFQAYADMDEGRQAKGGTQDLMSGVVTIWENDVKKMFESNNTSKQIQDIVLGKYMDHAKTMTEVLKKSYIEARKDHMKSKRTSSEAENEPKSTDALVTDFAVEAQAFANGLAKSALLATISLAVSNNEITMSGSKIFGVLLSLFNIPVAFNTMTNVARYQNRNEEFRAEYHREKLPELEKMLFKTLSPESRHKVTNPFVKKLETQFDEFVSSAEYYNADYESIKRMYDEMDKNNDAQVEDFMLQIQSHFVPVVYQKEVYLKDVLWQVHLACAEVVSVLRLQGAGGGRDCDQSIISILKNMPKFSNRLEKSLQTGPILWGFIRKGKTLPQCVLVAPFRYWTFKSYNFIMPKLNGVGWRPIPTAIRDIRTKVKKVNEFVGRNKLKKETRDLKELFNATMESALASTIYFIGCGSFTFAILLTAFNAFNLTVKVQEDVPQPVQTTETALRIAAPIISIFASLHASEYLVKQLIHQRKVLKAIASLPDEIKHSVIQVKSIAALQSCITFIRILAGFCTVISLLSTFYHNNLARIRIPITPEQTVLATFAAIGGWFIANFLEFYLEFFALWNLEPSAGYDICNAFHNALRKIYNEFSEGINIKNHILGPKMGDRIIREYTAKEFLDKTRFDSVLMADRFSAIMQTILSEDFDLSSSHEDGC